MNDARSDTERPLTRLEIVGLQSALLQQNQRVATLEAERDQLAWVIRELHEGACSPAYRPPDSDYRLWALEVIEREASDVFPQPAKADPPPASTESSHGSEDTDG